MGSLTVRVLPRSGRRSVEVADHGILVRVRAAPEGGKATEEARRTLAEALGAPPSAVTLRRGPRSQERRFDLAGMTDGEAMQRLRRSGR